MIFNTVLKEGNMTSSVKYVLSRCLAVPPSQPMIYDDRGKEVTGVAGPFFEDYDLVLFCHVMGGK
jgi:hypothetical protein